MSVILVEGESDRLALEVLGERMRLKLPRIVSVGGASGARRAAAQYRGQRLLGLVDVNERAQFDEVLTEVFVCVPDLEGELVRALTPSGVLEVIDAQGELESFRILQQQPAQRAASMESQLARFFGGRSGNKYRYAPLLAAAVPVDRVPIPMRDVILAAGE